MFIIDPIASLIVVAGVFIYFACKGISEKKPVKTRTEKEKWDDEVKRREEYVRMAKEKDPNWKNAKNDYVMWLYNHQQE
jgi:hypothetical protein